MNPFDGWTDEQQCKGCSAQNDKGYSVRATGPLAVKFCANGILDRAVATGTITDKQANDFSIWFRSNHDYLFRANDTGWTLAQFRAAWSEFTTAG